MAWSCFIVVGTTVGTTVRTTARTDNLRGSLQFLTHVRQYLIQSTFVRRPRFAF